MICRCICTGTRGKEWGYNLEAHTTQCIKIYMDRFNQGVNSFFSTVAAQILDPPDNLTVVEPQNATFSCLATGRPRPDIVWTKLSDMTQLQNQRSQSADFMIEEQEIGDRERRSNLTILDTQPPDAGAYACVGMNEPGTEREQAILTVHGEA